MRITDRRVAAVLGICCAGLLMAGAGRAEDMTVQAYKLLDAGDTEQAKRLFIDAVQLQQGSDNIALEGLATCLFVTEDYARAKRTLNILVRRDEGSAYAHALMGTVLAKEGAYDEAVAQLRRAIEKDPRRPSFHNNLGVVLMEKGDISGAESAFREALRIQSRHPEANYNLAVFYASGERKNIRDSRRNYETATRAGFPKDGRLERLY